MSKAVTWLLHKPTPTTRKSLKESTASRVIGELLPFIGCSLPSVHPNTTFCRPPTNLLTRQRHVPRCLQGTTTAPCFLLQTPLRHVLQLKAWSRFLRAPFCSTPSSDLQFGARLPRRSSAPHTSLGASAAASASSQVHAPCSLQRRTFPSPFSSCRPSSLRKGAARLLHGPPPPPAS